MIYFIVLLIVFNHAAFSGSRVGVSLYALELGADQLTVGIVMSLYAICPMLLGVYSGKLSDRLGPRLPMFIGTLGVGIALSLPLAFPGLTSLYIAALLLGSSFHFFFVPVQGTAGGVGGPGNRARNFAVISMGFSAASFIGPTVAGLAIDHIGHRLTFGVLAALTVLPLVLIWLRPDLLPKAAPASSESAGHRTRDLWQIPRLREMFIASGFVSAGWDLFQFYFPVYGHSIGLSASAIGTVLGVFALATFAIRTVLPAMLKRMTEVEILALAILVAACAFGLFPFFQNPYALGAVAFVLGLGLGCGQPMSMSLIYAMAPPGRAAESAGLRVTVNNVMHLVMPLLFGSVGSAFGYYPVFISNSALLAAGSALMHRSSRLQRQP
ncbi:MAG TPA: MFS transporter [Burkholderiales bacterium]